MLDFRRDFVVNNCLLVFTDDINAKFEVISRLKFVRFGFAVFLGKSSAIDEGTVG